MNFGALKAPKIFFRGPKLSKEILGVRNVENFSLSTRHMMTFLGPLVATIPFSIVPKCGVRVPCGAGSVQV